ncbi:MAG: ergothioneine biosynthesis glutamate--cysteine ligase EgtA, partial [Actinomycetota bacterium]|nr:ergothioneine biosynthesis glutamate--cysteine ligase EgtA [Actinomycetota bacterium]
SCLAAADLAAPPALRPAVSAYAELVHSGRSPGDRIREDLHRIGALGVLRAAALESALGQPDA